jgi:hypothetical protein
MYWRLQEILKKGKHSEPPVSLVGQLLWREFFYTCGATVENFDKMEGKIFQNISLYLMELPALKKCKQLFEYQHLLLLRNIW